MSGTKPNLNKGNKKWGENNQWPNEISKVLMITALEKTLEHSTAQYRQKRANQPLPHQYIYVYIYIAGKPCHKLQKLKHIQKGFRFIMSDSKL